MILLLVGSRFSRAKTLVIVYGSCFCSSSGFCAWALLRQRDLLYLYTPCLHLPVLALVGLFFTVSLMSGISTVAGAEAMSAVDAAQSGTASALMGTLMFVFGGIAAPLAGLGGETMLKMSLAMAICYLLALLLGLSKPRDAR